MEDLRGFFGRRDASAANAATGLAPGSLSIRTRVSINSGVKTDAGVTCS